MLRCSIHKKGRCQTRFFPFSLGGEKKGSGQVTASVVELAKIFLANSTYLCKHVLKRHEDKLACEHSSSRRELRSSTFIFLCANILHV